MRASAGRDVCTGSGNCAATCPELFAVCDGKSHVKATAMPEDIEDRILQAEDGCPVPTSGTGSYNVQ